MIYSGSAFEKVYNPMALNTYHDDISPDATERYSWWSYRAGARSKNIGWRIDYFLVSESLLPSVKEAFILEEVAGSDHCPVGIVLKF